MMNGLQTSIPQRMALLRIVLVFSLVISVFLSFNLWGGYRTFPATPVFEDNLVQPPFDFIFISLALLCWLLSLFLRGQRIFIFISFLLCFFLVLFDVNRLQPWFYIYNSMLAIYIFYNGRVDDPNKYTSFFIFLQIAFASVYFFTGLSQLNALFIDTSFAEIIEPLRSLVSERQFLLFKKTGFMSPYMLMFIGLGLIISPIRYLAISAAILVHLTLLIFLFPSAAHQNYALWFSNLSFIIMLLLLFSGKTKQRYFSPTFLFQQPLFYIIMFVFAVMPFFNITNKWPDFLSFNYRSGNNNSAVITLKKSLYDKLPLYQRHFCVASDSVFTFDYQRWVNHELKADCFPSYPVFNSIYTNLSQMGATGVKEIELRFIPKQKVLCKP